MKEVKTHLVKGGDYYPVTACGLMSWRVKTNCSYKKVDCIKCCQVYEKRKKK